MNKTDCFGSLPFGVRLETAPLRTKPGTGKSEDRTAPLGDRSETMMADHPGRPQISHPRLHASFDSTLSPHQFPSWTPIGCPTVEHRMRLRKGCIACIVHRASVKLCDPTDDRKRVADSMTSRDRGVWSAEGQETGRDVRTPRRLAVCPDTWSGKRSMLGFDSAPRCSSPGHALSSACLISDLFSDAPSQDRSSHRRLFSP